MNEMENIIIVWNKWRISIACKFILQIDQSKTDVNTYCAPVRASCGCVCWCTLEWMWLPVQLPLHQPGGSDGGSALAK